MSSDVSVNTASAMEASNQGIVHARKQEEKNKSKRHEDPLFDKLRDAAIDASHAKQPASPDSWYLKIFFAPLMAMSFILSLTYVSRQDRQRRTAEHELVLQRESWSWLPWKRWSGPEPYQQFKHGAHTVRQDPEKSVWVIRKNKMALGKMQMEDALKLHGTIMVLIIAGIFVLCAALYHISRWSWTRWAGT